MLDRQQISNLASEVAHAQVTDIALERVLTELTTDSDGRAALLVTLVLKPEAVRKLTGDQTLDMLVGIQRALSKAGDDRFPIVEYATEQELQAEGEDGDALVDDD